MSLRSRIALVLFVAVALVAGGDHFVNRLHLNEQFREFDVQRAEGQLDSIRRALDAELEGLGEAAELALERVQTAADGRRAGEAEFAAVLAPMPYDLRLAFDPEGRILHRSISAPMSGDAFTLRELRTDRLAPGSELLNAAVPGQPVQGILNTSEGALLVAVREAATQPPVRIAVGKLLDPGFLQRLSLHGGAGAQISWISNRNRSESQDTMLLRIERGEGCHFEEQGDSSLVAWGVVRSLSREFGHELNPDAKHAPALLLQVETARDYDGVRKAVAQYDLLSMGILVVLFPLVILVLLQWVVTGPLLSLTKRVLEIGQSGETDARLGLERGDEIGDLAREFDGMLQQLEESRAEVVRTARMAGMSEISSGVLHNVGNAINHVTTSARRSRGLIDDMSVLDDLRQVLGALHSNAGNIDSYLSEDERGKHLLRYFEAVVDRLEGLKESAAGELGDMDEGIEHVAVLLHSLQDTAKRLHVLERVDLAAQIDSVVEICLDTFPVTGLQVVRRFQPLPAYSMDRQRLMEVLVHLVKNALQSLAESDAYPRNLVLSLALEDDQLRIDVEDNGVGIAEENLEEVFSARFSTKPDARGLGLHLASTALGEMDGQLTVTSAGPGQGAQFTVTLPVPKRNVAADGESEVSESIESPRVIETTETTGA